MFTLIGMEPLSVTSRTRWTRLGDARIAYEVRGTGTPVVLLHGWGSDRRFWRAQLDATWSGVQLIAIDLIGHGHSDAPDAEYTADFLAASVTAVLDDLAVERAILVGHSMGVTVARQIYRASPERVIGLVVVDGFLREVPWSPWQEQMLVALKGPDYQSVIDQMVSMTPPTSAPPADVAQVGDALRRTPQHVIVGTLEGLRDAGLWREDAILVPTLVVRANTAFAPVDREGLAAELRELAPQSELHVWEDATHVLTQEHPDRFNELLQRFVARVSEVTASTRR